MDFACGINAVEHGHGNIEHGYIRTKRLRQLYGLRAMGRFGDDLEPLV